MKVCFCSSLYLDEEELAPLMKSQLSISVHKLVGYLVEGLDSHLKRPCYLLNIPEVPSYPKCKKVFFKKEYWNHRNDLKESDIEIGFINIAGIKYITQSICLIKGLDSWIKKQKGEKVVICSYGRRFSHVVAINYIKKKYPDVVTCAILGDLSGKYAGNVTIEKKQGIMALLLNRIMDFQMQEVQKFDCFVLVTKFMADALKLKKPFCVMEGIGNIPNFDQITYQNTDKKIIMYAGTLELQYNILDLIDAFELIENENYELWLYGDGSAKSLIQKKAIENNKIHFFGAVTSLEIKKAYEKATVLVNPRKNTGLYTKYTFPSKTMEYLASGKPVVGYKLDGMPDEYDNFMIYVKDNTAKELSKTLYSICEKSLIERKNIGYNAQNFIKNHKNPSAQCEKIIKMLRRI